MSEVWSDLLDELDGLQEQILDLGDLIVEQVAAIERGDIAEATAIEKDKERLIPALHRANSLVRAVLRDNPTFEELEDLGIIELLLALQGLGSDSKALEQTVTASYHVRQFKIRNFIKALRTANQRMTRYTPSGTVVTVDTIRSDENRNDI
jgi:hypothetical protein